MADSAATSKEPCPSCGCPGEEYDGHTCEDYAPEYDSPSAPSCPWCIGWAERQCDHAWGF